MEACSMVVIGHSINTSMQRRPSFRPGRWLVHVHGHRSTREELNITITNQAIYVGKQLDTFELEPLFAHHQMLGGYQEGVLRHVHVVPARKQRSQKNVLKGYALLLVHSNV